MSKYIATRAMRGASALVNETEAMLQKALAEKGPDCKVAFPNTAYYLPTIYGMTGTAVETLGQLSADFATRAIAAASAAVRQALDAVSGRNAGQRHGDAARRRNARSDPLCVWSAAGADGRLQTGGRHIVHQPRYGQRPAGHRWRPSQRPDRRHPTAIVGHSTRRWAHARLCGDRRLRQVERSRREDRSGVAAPQYSYVPIG